MNLYKILNIENEKLCSLEYIDKTFMESEQSKEQRMAWKILRDPYYQQVYKKYNSAETVIKAGFFEDTLEPEDIDFYNINLLTTPLHKLKSGTNPVVLLSTGGFYPIHNGHFYMMESAKEALTKKGYTVAGGFLSPCHDDYISTKPYFCETASERVYECQKALSNHEWLSVDPFEALYTKTTINFTDVIARLEAYLHRYFDPETQVVYVYGADNADFSYCFEDKGMGICIDRDKHHAEFINAKRYFNNERILFLENKKEYSCFESREIRKYKKSTKNEKKEGSYLIRNEGILPLEHLLKKCDVESLKSAQNQFLADICMVLGKTFNNIKTVNVSDQVEYASKNLYGNKTISLDSYFIGTYNLEVSRLFYPSDGQFRYTKLVGRNGSRLESCIDTIPAGDYILVDDDSISGKTIKDLTSMLPADVNIKFIYLLSSLIKEKPYDVVDCRDFIAGANNAGLMARITPDQCIRIPYLSPYVSLRTRASVPSGSEKEMSADIWKLNKRFYETIGNVQLNDLSNDFIELMNYIGFKEEDSIVDICNWHINKLL